MFLLYADVLVLVCLVGLARAGFYADNGLDRTISYRSLPTQEKREMENEILNLLGLDHRPKPKIHQTSNSAPKYLIDLYNQLDPENDDRNASFRDVDFIVSFVNHHNNEDDELSIEPKLRFDKTRSVPVDLTPQDRVEGVTSTMPPHSTAPSSTSGTTTAATAAAKTAAATAATTAAATAATTTAATAAATESTTSTSEKTAREHDQSTAESAVVNNEQTLSVSGELSSVRHRVTVEQQQQQSSSSESSVVDGLTSQTSARKTRSIRPSLDYADEFSFFEQPFEVQVFCMRHGNFLGDIALEAVANYTVDANETGWIRLNATNPLLSWVAFPGENFGLVVRLIDPESGLQLSPSQVGLVMGGTGEFAPFMAAFMKESSGAKRRPTRASEKSRREKPPVSYIGDDVPSYEIRHHFSRRNFCQKRTLYVSFRDLGWQDWIIAPDGYSAFYCDGECSFPLNMNATNHAIVQTLVHLVSPNRAPTACCAPTKLAPIMVLYFDDNSNVILKKYKNMVVRSCGCH
ncbi:bone morphogenetic protein 7-like [Tropilaelaps mercedesae]|uniref:Bone morphogenetic protein 7-like n=1 Tax=Tropilaelaps mercedesae TaxID=418985 RepID=A0A1V9X6T6_9ACAR|nr:bone morphogenetic protein 7-like [Tropilaelaps mercedesae]